MVPKLSLAANQGMFLFVELTAHTLMSKWSVAVQVEVTN